MNQKNPQLKTIKQELNKKNNKILKIMQKEFTYRNQKTRHLAKYIPALTI